MKGASYVFFMPILGQKYSEPSIKDNFENNQEFPSAWKFINLVIKH